MTESDQERADLVRQMVTESRIRSGVPEKVEDRTVLARVVARMLQPRQAVEFSLK